MTQTLNLDLIPEKKILNLGGKSFDVTRMPLAIFLMIQKKFKDGGIDTAWYREPLAEWLKIADPSVTLDWVNEKTDDTVIMRAIERSLFDPVITDPLPVWISDQPTPDPEPTKKKTSSS